MCMPCAWLPHVQDRVSQPTLLLQTQKTQQLWNAASNDEISTYNVGKAHSYGALSEKKSAE